MLAASGLALEAPLPGGAGESVGEALLQPHRWYGRALLPLLPAGGVRAMAHVTGGGIAGNLVRVLPEGCARACGPTRGRGRRSSAGWWQAGGVPEADAREALNLGIGHGAWSCPPIGRRDSPRARRPPARRCGALGDVRAGARGVEWDTA